MQAMMVLGLLVSIMLFVLIENDRANPTNNNKYADYQATSIAANVIEYNDLITQYALANYANLHLASTDILGAVQDITLINYTQDNIASLTAKDFNPFFTYSSFIFNYVPLESGESMPLPILYVATSWNNANTKFNVPMIAVMGALNDYLATHVYEGYSNYWAIPWLIEQDNCNVIEIFSQIANDENNNSQYTQVVNLFQQLCLQFTQNDGVTLGEYVYISPVFVPEQTY